MLPPGPPRASLKHIQGKLRHSPEYGNYGFKPSGADEDIASLSFSLCTNTVVTAGSKWALLTPAHSQLAVFLFLRRK